MVIPTQTEYERVAELLGRPPSGKFEIVVRDNSGDPIVIRNYPVLENGKPMPTLYWLVSEELRSRIGTLESQGGVKKAEADGILVWGDNDRVRISAHVFTTATDVEVFLDKLPRYLD